MRLYHLETSEEGRGRDYGGYLSSPLFILPLWQNSSSLGTRGVGIRNTYHRSPHSVQFPLVSFSSLPPAFPSSPFIQCKYQTSHWWRPAQEVSPRKSLGQRVGVRNTCDRSPHTTRYLLYPLPLSTFPHSSSLFISSASPLLFLWLNFPWCIASPPTTGTLVLFCDQYMGYERSRR